MRRCQPSRSLRPETSHGAQACTGNSLSLLRSKCRKPDIAQGACRAEPADRRSAGGGGLFERTALSLVFLHRAEQRRDVALAEAFVALALDELEEHRTDHQAAEDLHQQARFALAGSPVHENAPLAQLRQGLAVARQAGL